LQPSPIAVVIACILAAVGALGIAATRHEDGATTDGPDLPSDAVTFGFVVRSDEPVPLLEATKPFRLELANGPVHGVPPTPAHFATASAIVRRELSRYPLDFLHRARLAGVVFVDDLAENEAPIPSLPNVGGLLLLDAAGVESDLVRGIHHEVFHFFDVADDGAVSPDPAWEALAPPGFIYGSGGRTMRSVWAALPATNLPGFVSAYATSGVEEDKAETFAFAVARPDLVRARLPTDAVLRAKVRELARRVATFDVHCPRRVGLDVLTR
jgi:hypothetical protein